MSYHIISSRVCFSDLSSNLFFAFPRFDIRELKLEDVNGASWSHRVAGGASSNLLAPIRGGWWWTLFFWSQPKNLVAFLGGIFIFRNRFCFFFKDFYRIATKSCVLCFFFPWDLDAMKSWSKKPFRMFGNGPTVDGQNPAPPGMMTIPLFRGFQPSQVVQHFIHQQYVAGIRLVRQQDWWIF